MKTLKVFVLLLIFTAAPILAQVAVMADVSGTPLSDTPQKFSTWKLGVRIGINEDLSLTGMFRSSRSRTVSVPIPEASPSDAGLIGVYYRINPFLRFGVSGGLQTRQDVDKKDLGWIFGGDLFLGMVSTKNHYLKKQVFAYIHIEKGQWDTKPYIDARAMFPLLDFVAVGGKHDSDLGSGPTLEVKIPLANQEEMKAIYMYGTYFFSGEVKTPVIGVRIAVN